MFGLAVGIGAALLFPVIAVAVYQGRERRHHRRMGRRKTDKIRL